MNICPRCKTPVYFAEEIICISKKWHKMCLKCVSCQKRLDSTSVTDHDNEIYCRPCHGKQFGPKGYGFAGGASGLSMDTGVDTISSSNIPATAQAHVAPRRASASHVTSNNNNAPSDKKPKKWGVTEHCPRCSQPVYLAERMQAAGKSYHKSCFVCFNEACNKRLDTGSLCERESQIYCKPCYGRLFGPKGIGFGVGAGALQMAQ